MFPIVSKVIKKRSELIFISRKKCITVFIMCLIIYSFLELRNYINGSHSFQQMSPHLLKFLWSYPKPSNPFLCEVECSAQDFCKFPCAYMCVVIASSQLLLPLYSWFHFCLLLHSIIFSFLLAKWNTELNYFSVTSIKKKAQIWHLYMHNQVYRDFGNRGESIKKYSAYLNI